MQKSTIIPLQNNSLSELMKTRKVVEIFLHCGLKVKGVIKGFDNFIIIIDSFGIQQLVYKHAIADIHGAQSARKSNNYSSARPTDRSGYRQNDRSESRSSERPSTRPKILTWNSD